MMLAALAPNQLRVEIERLEDRLRADIQFYGLDAPCVKRLQAELSELKALASS